MDAPSLAESVADDVSSKMAKGFISPRTLLARMSVVDSPSRTATVYQDSNYLPFYFHLGRALAPKDVLCVGLETGIQLGCLLKGCPAPRSATCVQPSDGSFYSPRVALSNIRFATSKGFPVSVHVGSAGDAAMDGTRTKRFGLCMIVSHLPVDSLMDTMDFCWSVVGEGGLLVVDMLDEGRTGVVFSDFCRARSLPHRTLKTRYGTGIAGR